MLVDHLLGSDFNMSKHKFGNGPTTEGGSPLDQIFCSCDTRVSIRADLEVLFAVAIILLLDSFNCTAYFRTSQFESITLPKPKVTSSSSSSLHFLETKAISLLWNVSISAEKHNSLHRSRNGRPHQAVEPVVVRLLGPLFPFVYASAAGFSLDEVLRVQMLGEHAMRLCIAAKERGNRDHPSIREASVHKRLPPVRIEHDVSDGSFAVNIGDTPIESYAITWSATILAKWQTDAPTNRPWLGMITAACFDCRQNW